MKPICLTNTLTYLIRYDGVLTLVYGRYIKLQHQPMVLPCISTLQPFEILLKRNSNAVDTLAHSRKQKWSLLLDLSSLRHYPWFQSLENQENFVQFIIFHTLICHPLIFHQLIILLTPICTIACGVPLLPYATPSIIYPLALKPRFETSQRHIAPFQSRQINGPPCGQIT